MSSEWTKFTDVLAHVVDNRGRTCPVGLQGMPLIATNCINGESLYPSYSTNRFVAPETYATWFRGHPQPGDILFVCKGSPGRTCWVPDPVDFCIAQDMVAVRADENKICPKYLFAALRSPLVQSQISNMHVGTMIPHFKKGDFDKLLIPLPARKEQEEIGDFYFSLSSRIALLRETNKTLESIAQAIFKSWFVDFDPVRAKMEGRQPEGMDEETAALFPDSFEESELGLIPKGWNVGKLGDVLSLRSERLSPGEYTESLPYVPIESIGAKNPFLEEFKPGREAKSSLTLFRQGDILFGAMRPYFHKVCIAPFDGVTRTTVFTLKPKISNAFAHAFFVAYSALTIHYATLNSEGSTIPYAKWKNSLDMMSIVLPPENIRRIFNNVVSAPLKAGAANVERIAVLRELRDTLLPRLISGQLRLPDTMEEMRA